MNILSSKKRGKQKGAAVVEFAILSLLLLVLMFGLIEFGFLWLQNHYIANAAREGARIASRMEPGSLNDKKIEKSIVDHLLGIYNFDPASDVSCCNGGSNNKLVGINIESGIISSQNKFSTGTDPTAPKAVEVTVNVMSGDIYDPILWDLLYLIAGKQEDEIRQITESAVFIFESR